VEDKLGMALDEEIKSREIVTSMLDDNNQIREQLEQRIEELKRTQNMLVQSEKLASLGRLVSEIAHEVNNPLMIISGNAQLSLMAGPLSDEVKNNLEIITNECQRAKSIIQRLLKFSKPSKGETKQVDINKSIESVVGIMENQFKLANVDIKREYREDLPLITIDEQQMHEVFMNLINNAKDAMPDSGGTITITTSSEGDYLRIDFKDNGCGMSEDMKQRFPEPFFTTKEKGTGLGLSVCYGIIKVHSGEIKLQSELNKGTTVTVLLPCAMGTLPKVPH
jgi:two-component system sporulation sensor kinase A